MVQLYFFSLEKYKIKKPEVEHTIIIEKKGEIFDFSFFFIHQTTSIQGPLHCHNRKVEFFQSLLLITS